MWMVPTLVVIVFLALQEAIAQIMLPLPKLYFARKENIAQQVQQLQLIVKLGITAL
jgi:hypothetical protein